MFIRSVHPLQSDCDAQASLDKHTESWMFLDEMQQ
jgi:hypothetical protein